MPSLALLLIYALVPLVGAVAWLIGWQLGNENLSQKGEILVFVWMGIDVLLLISNWAFGWLDWLL